MSEAQEEEIEVLKSIYDGDSAFTEVSSTCFQYRFGEEGVFKSFNVEVSWPPTYPDTLPTISLDTFYNGHVVAEVKTVVKAAADTVAKDEVGSAVTFTVFEHVRDRLEEFLELQPESATRSQNSGGGGGTDEVVSSKKPKKEQLTKSQKRRHFDRVGQDGELPRGYNWVSVVRHLQQTGSAAAD